SFCLSDDFRGEVTRVSQLNVTWRHVFPTKTGCFTQGCADNASANIGGPRIALRKLLPCEVSTRACQISIVQFFKIGAKQCSFFEFLCRGRDRLGCLSKLLEQGNLLNAVFLLLHRQVGHRPVFSVRFSLAPSAPKRQADELPTPPVLLLCGRRYNPKSKFGTRKVDSQCTP